MADRIIAWFSNESILANGEEISEITLSIGITEYKRNEEQETFIHRADIAMYEAKQQKGNSLIISS